MTRARYVDAVLRIIADPKPAAYYQCLRCPYTASAQGRTNGPRVRAGHPHQPPGHLPGQPERHQLMTQVKFDSKVLADVEKALAPHAKQLFKELGTQVMAVIELASVERTEQGPDEEKEDSVKVRVVDLEIAGDEVTDERLRQQMSTLHRQRTSGGTFDSLAS